MCVFCSNALYRIGACDYEEELQPIASGDIGPLAAAPDSPDPLVDKAEQMRLLSELVGAQTVQAASARRRAPGAATQRLIVRGTVVSMTGDPQPNSAVCIADGR